MPELVHDCGKRVRFPSGTEGRRGKCPHCGGSVAVPEAESGLGAPPRVTLEPPANWEAYLEYLQDKGPPPRPVVMPHKLMLQTDADEQWERRVDVRPSKFHCPNCKARINMDQLLCTGCGVDFRTGYTVDRSARLNEKGMAYLAQIPWLEAAEGANEEEVEEGGDDDPPDRPRIKRRRRPG